MMVRSLQMDPGMDAEPDCRVCPADKGKYDNRGRILSENWDEVVEECTKQAGIVRPGKNVEFTECEMQR